MKFSFTKNPESHFYKESKLKKKNIKILVASVSNFFTKNPNLNLNLFIYFFFFFFWGGGGLG